MKTIVLATVAAFLFFTAVARAQDTWVQLEARSTLAEAEDRARAWSSVFPNVNGFRLSSGWYAVALGPFIPDIAGDRLFSLRAEQLIPADAFIADGSLFQSQFWPVGAAALRPQAPESQSDPVVVIQPAPEETPAEARRSEADLDADGRKALQTALKWFGFYDAEIDGAFGRGTRASMATWQAANGFVDTGILTTRQRGVLLAAYRGELDALGLGQVVEDRAGIEIEMPIGLVEFEDYAPPFVRYREKDGSGVRVLLISQEGTQSTLDGLFDVMQSLEIVPLEGFRERQGESFILTGQNDRIHSTTYARLEDGMVKGFTLVHRPEDAARMERVVTIMRESLRSTGRALDPTLGSAVGGQSRDLLSGLEIRQPERSRSGVYVDDRGAVLTVAEAVAGCARIMLDDLHEARLVAEDTGSGLALLRPEVPLAPMQVARIASADPRIGAAAAVAGFPFGGALPGATLTFGTVEDLAGLAGEAGLIRLQAETEPGEAGGPVFDPAGRVAGVLLPAPESGTRQLPPGVRFAAKPGVASAFLAAQGVVTPAMAEDGALAPEDLTEAAMQMTVLVSCWN